MIREWIYNKLKIKAFKEKQEVKRLQWQKLKLERQIALAKREQDKKICRIKDKV